ncbi:hypothetical protein KSS87_004520 [Heliosperma pusillum]|nr:hypothetical protein KSS87_004520 [Heliosperma pusillum]
MLDMELPEELLIQILVLLPVKFLLRSKCVCKHWLSVIKSPQFVDYHRHLSETRRSSKLLCYRKDPTTEIHVISALDRHTLEKHEDLQWPPFLEEEGENVEEEWFDGPESWLRRIKIFGPVNGIYCIFRTLIRKWVGTLTLWNPATREYKHIHPQIAFPFRMHLLGCKDDSLMRFHEQLPQSLNIGFGFDHGTNDYKVVVISQWEDAETGDDRRWHLRVYNHASDTWKSLYFLNCIDDPHPLFEGAFPPFPLMEFDPPISHCLLHGVFHWACSLQYFTGNFYTVLAFDMDTDALRLIKGPPIPTHSRLSWSVWVLKDTIAAVSCVMADSYAQSDVEVWMMMEYGVENSWAILYSFQGVNGWSPIGTPYNDQIFFDNWDGQLLSLGIDEDRQVQKRDVYGMVYSTLIGLRGTLGILDYFETHTRLKSV